MKSLMKQNRGLMRKADIMRKRGHLTVREVEHVQLPKRCCRVRVLRGTWQGRVGQITRYFSEHGVTTIVLALALSSGRKLSVRVPFADVTPAAN